MSIENIKNIKNIAIGSVLILVAICFMLGGIKETDEDFYAQCERQLPIYMLVHKIDNPDTYCWDAIYGGQ